MTIAELTGRVAQWMRDFGQAVPDSIQPPITDTRLMRHRLIDEENNELFSARTDAERLDAIADLLVVVVGAAADLGIKPETLEAHLEDVLKANDAKRWTVEETAQTPRDWVASVVPWSDLCAVRDQTGKIRKPPGWTAPDPQRHIDAQRMGEE
jgi:predicted HAD superfamily Cof-like phosphohydrolase